MPTRGKDRRAIRLSVRQRLLALTVALLLTATAVQVVSYVRFRSVMLVRSREATVAVLQQIEQSISTSIASAHAIGTTMSQTSTVQSYLAHRSPIERLERYPDLRSIFRSFVETSSIVSAIVLSDPMHVTVVDLGAAVAPIALIESARDQHASAPTTPLGSGSLVWADDYGSREPEVWFLVMVPVFDTQPGFEPGNRVGAVTVAGRAEVFAPSLEAARTDATTAVMVVDTDGSILLRVADPGFENAPLRTDGAASEGPIVSSAGERYLHSRTPIRGTSWSLHSFTSIRTAQRDLVEVQTFIVAVTLVASGVAVIVALVSIRRIVAPLDEIVQFANSVHDPAHEDRLGDAGIREFDVVATHINQMLDRVQEMAAAREQSQARMFELQLSRKQAELSALETQIHPHFLYNTLDCIRSIGYGYEAPEIVDVSSSLAEILRYIIKAPEVVRLGDEMECVERYMRIMEIRFPRRFRLETCVEPGLLAGNALKMTLQPLAENAVYHGLEPRRGGGTLSIAARREDGSLVIDVSDNGIGMSAERLEQVREALADASAGRPVAIAQTTGGVGMVNVHARIVFTYGDSYGLVLSSDRGGTTVRVRMPYARSGRSRSEVSMGEGGASHTSG